MGCDIHCYVEYRKHQEVHDEWSRYWSGFGGRINPGRNYEFFARLAGVRGDWGDKDAIAAGRGLPDDVSWRASSDNLLTIKYSPQPGIYSDGEVSPETAERWSKNGSKYIYLKDAAGVQAEKPHAVTHPDWHSHSWATPTEFAKAARGCGACEYKALIAAMRSLERSGCEVRVVFWFDN